MKKWRKWILPAILALLLAIPLSVQAGFVEDDEEVFKAHGKKGYHHPHGGWVHHEMYFHLLVEKYAPETAAEWNPALAEKKRLMEELRAYYKENPDRAKKDMKELKKEREAKNEQREQVRASHERFAEAVQVKDEAKIREALTEQLQILKDQNQQLANRLADLKKK